jgi:hypothetical protein
MNGTFDGTVRGFRPLILNTSNTFNGLVGCSVAEMDAWVADTGDGTLVCVELVMSCKVHGVEMNGIAVVSVPFLSLFLASFCSAPLKNRH